MGVHGPADPATWAWTQQVFDAIATARCESVKVLIPGTSGAQINRLRQIGVRLVVARLFYKFEQRTSPAQFVNILAPAISEAVGAGVRWFEVHNEPNLHTHDSPEGMWLQWRDGGEFAAWFVEVLGLLRARWPGCLWGYPGLSDGPAVTGIRYDGPRFWAESKAATDAADWIGVHTYWGQAGTRVETSIDYVRGKVQQLPRKLLMVTEFSNNAPGVDPREKGAQYLVFYRAMAGLPSVAAAHSFIVSASAGFGPEVWLNTAIPAVVGQRNF